MYTACATASGTATHPLDKLLELTHFLSVQQLIGIRIQLGKLPVEHSGIANSSRLGLSGAHVLAAKHLDQMIVKRQTIRLAARTMSRSGDLAAIGHIRIQAELALRRPTAIVAPVGAALGPAATRGGIPDGFAAAVAAPAAGTDQALYGRIVAVAAAARKEDFRIACTLPSVLQRDQAA